MIWRNFFSVRENFSFFHTVQVVEINGNYFYFRRKFREIKGFTKLLTKDWIWRNIFSWEYIFQFSTVHYDYHASYWFVLFESKRNSIKYSMNKLMLIITAVLSLKVKTIFNIIQSNPKVFFNLSRKYKSIENLVLTIWL